MTAVGFPRVERYLEIARAPLDRMRKLVLPNPGRPEETFREHSAIVQAIRSGDAEFASAAMRAHLSAVAQSVEAQLRIAGDMLEQ